MELGYVFDLTRTCREEMLRASILSMEHGDNTGLESIFRKTLRPADGESVRDMLK